MQNWDQIGVSKKGKWTCVKCKHVNSSSKSACDKCFHEPAAGRRDVNPEGRKYTPPEDER